MTNNLCCELNVGMLCVECDQKVCEACWVTFYDNHLEWPGGHFKYYDGNLSTYEPRWCTLTNKIVRHSGHTIGDDIYRFKNYE